MDHADLRPYGAFDEACADANNIAESSSTGSSRTASHHEPTSTSAGSSTAQQQEIAGPIENETILEKSSKASHDEAVTELETIISDNSRANCISLLDWISASEGQNSLKRMASDCYRGMEQFENKAMATVKENIERAIELAQRVS